MPNDFDASTWRRPPVWRWVLNAAPFAATILPAALLTAISGGWTTLALRALLASASLYTIGYYTAASRYRRRLRDEVADARRDPLTGLPTRTLADELLDAATRGAASVTVALADVDGLKAVNTNLGHAAGDQYIQVVARRLALALPPGGTLVRQGGDEFTFVVPNIDPTQLVTRIGATMSGPATIAGYRLHPRASVGIAQNHGGDANYARACADAALHTAKATGGNHLLIHDASRDGQPQRDGTRPVVRRRDIDPVDRDRVGPLPTPRDDPPAFLSVAEARAAHDVIVAASDRCTPGQR